MLGSRKKQKSDWEALPGKRKRFRWSESKQDFILEDGTSVPRKWLPEHAVQRLTSAPDMPGSATWQSSSQIAGPNVSTNVRYGSDKAPISPTPSGPSASQSHFSNSPAKAGYASPQSTSAPGPAGYPDLGTPSGVREYTATDKATQVQTRWIRSTGQSTTPNQTQEGNVKKFGETSGGAETKYKEYKKRGKADFKFGTVIEMLIALPPSHSPISHVTTITAIRPSFAGGTRMRRFVVIRAETLDGSPGFLALPISTYEGLGVAKTGVIKACHAIVYTSRVAPAATQGELVQRLPSGGLETGMQPNAIRVRPNYPDRSGYALDPMARLNFGSIQSFDYGVKVKLFGKVHEDSTSALEYQFRLVWRGTPMVAQQHYTAQDAGAAQPVADTNISGHSHHRTDSGVNFEGPVDLQQITNALQRVRISAEHQDLPAPQPDDATKQRLAQDHVARQQYFDLIRSRWRTILQRRMQPDIETPRDDADNDEDDENSNTNDDHENDDNNDNNENSDNNDEGDETTDDSGEESSGKEASESSDPAL